MGKFRVGFRTPTARGLILYARRVFGRSQTRPQAQTPQQSDFEREIDRLAIPYDILITGACRAEYLAGDRSHTQEYVVHLIRNWGERRLRGEVLGMGKRKKRVVWMRGGGRESM